MGLFDRFKKPEPAPPPPPSAKALLEAKLAPVYPRLARQITAMTPAEWEVIYFLGEAEPDKSSWSSVFYIQEVGGGRIVRSGEIPAIYNVPNAEYLDQWARLNDILMELYRCFLEEGQKPWQQMSMTLEQSGRFNIQYLYDTIHDGDGGQLAREVLWAYQTFKYLPREGTGMRDLLERQLRGARN